MKKPDLKVGMIVKLRNGDVCLVTQNTKGDLFFTNNSGWVSIDSYNEDLTITRSMHCLDIIEVHGYRGSGYAFESLLNLNSNSHILLWERKEVKEMTVAEISEALGYEVKVVK